MLTQLYLPKIWWAVRTQLLNQEEVEVEHELSCTVEYIVWNKIRDNTLSENIIETQLNKDIKNAY